MIVLFETLMGCAIIFLDWNYSAILEFTLFTQELLHKIGLYQMEYNWSTDVYLLRGSLQKLYLESKR